MFVSSINMWLFFQLLKKQSFFKQTLLYLRVKLKFLIISFFKQFLEDNYFVHHWIFILKYNL